ncbi:MAG TPA: radical SAM protein [Candidatus Sumerlaeota bacterium]|nr:MAG: Spore photoproduct lyase [candidate division BRC1 bacterium ADurb.Bin183]HOE63361.1 radical SAM protein [Candidatus Sumerlaeota bacterium]HRR30364.1 radical SAM protein [Candidatus Sumerlaeia bacterium]HON50684.1 radical SAM protein [Candidatus Sumerlaeota bacterium]HOR65198.1 radical SAM protein [Candidatus Sumerlaeota bacterium]
MNSIERVFVEKGCEDIAYAQQMLGRLSNTPAEIIPNIKDFLAQSTAEPSKIAQGKRTLLLMKNRGRFLKTCPGTKHHLCCGYLTLHHAAGCPLDCSYCILQAYLNNPFIVYYVNENDMLAELREIFAQAKNSILRFGTGEFTDSLALEPIARTTELFLPLLREFPNVFLEVKTKAADISPILGMEPRRQIIFAWSLNPQRIIDAEESGAASLDERLKAAQIIQEAGYPVAFHFDPLLRFEGWEEEYEGVVKKLAEAVDLSRVFWVSLGVFRFPPSLKNIIQERFPQNRLIYEEFIIGEDGKMRIFKPLRREMFRHLLQALRSACPDVFCYLCMERADVWDDLFGFHPENNLQLKSMLDQRCEREVHIK